MGSQKPQLLGSMILMAALYSANALTGSPPVLSDPVRSGEQFQFTLRGQTNVSYVIEWSSDLVVWVPAVTNSDSQATRIVATPASPGAAFWRVHRPASPAFAYAIAARSRVTLGGSGRIDSFNSTNTLESTTGWYDPLKATDRAKIGCASSSTIAFNIGNMDVHGTVATEPSGTVSLGPNGCAGSKLFVSNPVNGGKIEPGYRREDMNLAFAPAKLPVPFGPAMTPGAGNVGGTNYNYVLGDGDYQIQSINLGSGEKILVNGKARIHVVGSTSVFGSGTVIISRGTSLEWYAGDTVNWGGFGCINGSGFAKDFSIIGLSSASVSYNGSASFIGTIYAPTATVTIGGTTNSVGALVCDTVELSGGMSLHFDESLVHAGPWF